MQTSGKNSNNRRPKLAAGGYITFSVVFDHNRVTNNQKAGGTPLVDTESNEELLGVEEGDVLFWVDGPPNRMPTAGYVSNTFAGEGRVLNVDSRTKAESVDLMIRRFRVAGVATNRVAMKLAKSTKAKLACAINRLSPILMDTDVTAGQLVRMVRSSTPGVKKPVGAAVSSRLTAQSIGDILRHHAMKPDEPASNPAENGLFRALDLLLKLNTVQTLEVLLAEGFLVPGPNNPKSLDTGLVAGGALSPDGARSYAERFAALAQLIPAQRGTFNPTQNAFVEDGRRRVQLATTRIIAQTILHPQNANAYFGGGKSATVGFNQTTKQPVSNAAGMVIQAQLTGTNAFTGAMLDVIGDDGSIIGMSTQNGKENTTVDVIVGRK